MATSTLGSGTLVLAGTTSGTTTVTATAVAGTTTLTLPAATDTLVGKATTDTLTNKTLTSATLTGVATFDAGTAALPAITTTGDTNTGIFFPAADTIAFSEGGVEAARFDHLFNLLVGGTTQSGTANRVAVFSANKFGLSIIDTTAQATGVGGALNLGGNYRSAGDAQAFARVAAVKENSTDTNYAYGMAFSVTPNGGTFTEAGRFDSSGNLGIGTTSPSNFGNANNRGLTVNGQGTAGFLELQSSGTAYGAVYANSSNAGIRSITALPLTFETNSTERARISSDGNLLVGTTTASAQFHLSNAGGGGTEVMRITTAGGQTNSFYYPSNGLSGTAPSSASTVQRIWRDASTARSINAAGTVNQSGADYAEYMTKSGDFTVAKGDVIGINSDGKLTNIFADAISFCVKSTDPGLVGNDSWGNNLDGEELEAARQTVDRIAFAGQVPVNVIGAIAGQYIIPVNNNGTIKGQAVSNPTFEQYQIAVGKVIAIESDGRARIIVKVA